MYAVLYIIYIYISGICINVPEIMNEYGFIMNISIQFRLVYSYYASFFIVKTHTQI